MKIGIAFALFLAALNLEAVTTIRWEIETARPPELNETVSRGETIILAPKFKDYGVPRAFGSSDWATLYYQTNGMGSNWFTNVTTTISLTDTGRVSATWTPDLDVGASRYRFFVGVVQGTAITYRAYGTMTMKASPGFLPAVRQPTAAPFATLAFASGALDRANAAYDLASAAGSGSGSDEVARASAAAAQAGVVAVSGRVSTVEGWGSHAQAGYLTSETDPHAAGIVSQLWASIGSTSTVFRATEAGMLSIYNGNMSMTLSNGMLVVTEITNSASVYVVSTNGSEYNGMQSGRVSNGLWYDASPGDPGVRVTDFEYDGGWVLFLSGQEGSGGNPGYALWQRQGNDPPTAGYNGNFGSPSLILEGSSLGTITLDWLPITNVHLIGAPFDPAALWQAYSNLSGIVTGLVTPAYQWQGAQAVVTNAWTGTTNGYAFNDGGQYQLVPYTESRHDVTGSLSIVSSRYIVDVTADWILANADTVQFPKVPMRYESVRTSGTSWVLRAWCSSSPFDNNNYYWAFASNVTVITYDRPGMDALHYTQDAAGIVARVDAPQSSDGRGVMNQAAVDAAITARKTEIADEAWNRTPGGRDTPNRGVCTIDEPLVQQGAISYLQSGDYYVFSYAGGDWYNSTSGSVWRIGPAGRTAFEITSTNRMLHVQALNVEGGYATLDISTNWVVGTPSIEFCQDLTNPQWLSCPAQTMTNETTYWRGVCPTGTNVSRFFRVMSPGGESLIKSHFNHEFLDGITVGGVTITNWLQLKSLPGW